jgi:hypothetical protein
VLFGFHDEPGGSFAEVEACAGGVKWPAWGAVEYFECVESVEVESGEAFGSSGGYDSGATGLQEFPAKQDGVGGGAVFSMACGL